MRKDGQPKHRQAAGELRRRAAQRQAGERLLIIWEGAKTEPLYLREIPGTRCRVTSPRASVDAH